MMGAKEKSDGILDKIDLAQFGRARKIKQPGSDTMTPTAELLRDLDACGGANFNVQYFNKPEVMAALHVDQEGPVAAGKTEWAECAREPFFNYTKTVTSHTPTYQQHLVPEMRVLIFSGDVDACVPYLGSMRWVAEVAENNVDAREGGSGYQGGDRWPVIGDAWTSWQVDNNVAGYFTAYATSGPHNFTFVTVKGAGHMVAEVKPKQALSLFFRFLNGLPMDYTEPEPLIIDTQPASTTALAGEMVRLSIVVSKGTAPYLYTWFKDGTELHDQFGPSLIISSATTDDSGRYYAQVAGVLGGTQWSDEAVVTIAATPCYTDASGSSMVGYVVSLMFGVGISVAAKTICVTKRAQKGNYVYLDPKLRIADGE